VNSARGNITIDILLLEVYYCLEMAAIETNYLIPHATQDTYVAALRTIPVTPIHAEIAFQAEGLDAPFTRDQEEIERYMKECSIKSIVPYSVTNIAIRDGKVFTTESVVEFPKSVDSEAVREAVIFSRFDRMREQTVHLRFPIYDQWGSYEAIKERHLDQLLYRGYQVNKAELWLSSYHQSGYNDGDYPATTVTINQIGNKGLVMRLDTDHSKVEDLDKLRTWFEDLQRQNSSK
jgi:hypothetical protein